MENISVLKSPFVISDKTGETRINKAINSRKRSSLSPDIIDLIAKEDVNFFSYIKNLDLYGEPDLIVLSAKHHYYYDENDLKSVRILLNIKKLNLIKDLDSFMHSVFHILPPGASFIGCFTDSGERKKIGSRFYHSSRLYNRLFNFLDSRTDRKMNEKDVRELLHSHGFKVLDMNKIGEQTFFIARNLRMSFE